MDVSPADGSLPPTLRAFGRWCRARRRARRLTPTALGAPEFSAAAIRALEHGAWRPSPLAWALLAARLDVPATAWDLATLPPPPRPDLPALDADLIYQLDHVRRLLEDQQPVAAQHLLAELAVAAQPQLAHLPLDTRYRLHRLRAFAAVQQGRPAAALPDLEQALLLASHLPDPQEVVRIQNILGAMYYTLDQPAQAFHQHERCLQAIRVGVVKDLTLRLNIYGNLANDSWALGDLAQAIGFYQEARALLPDLADPVRAAAVDWGLSTAYRATGDLARATLYARQALQQYATAGQGEAVARLQVNLAALLCEQGAYAAAAEQLEDARRYQQAAGQDVLLSVVYEHYALLELARGNLPQAAHYVQAGLALVPPGGRDLAGAEPAHRQRTGARLWRTAGLIAAQQGAAGEADRCFQQALQWVGQTEDAATHATVAYEYAEILRARGAYEQAVPYYRRAMAAPAASPAPQRSAQ